MMKHSTITKFFFQMNITRGIRAAVMYFSRLNKFIQLDTNLRDSILRNGIPSLTHRVFDIITSAMKGGMKRASFAEILICDTYDARMLDEYLTLNTTLPTFHFILHVLSFISCYLLFFSFSLSLCMRVCIFI